MTTLVLSLPGAMELGVSLARLLRCEHDEVIVHNFPDGETLVRIDKPVRDRNVVLACSLDHPDGKTLPLLFTADTARELGAMQVGLVAPYLAYMRQDKRFHPGEAITSHSYARLLSGSLDFLVTVDPHLHRWRTLGELYAIRSEAVAAAPAIARWIRRNVREPVLIGPDGESEQWVSEVARLVQAPHAVLSKVRSGDRDVRVSFEGAAHWPGRTPVLLDDIVSTGHTIAAAAQLLARAGMPPALCVAVHALFDAGALDRLANAGVGRVVTCDTVAHPTNSIRLAPALARAVRSFVRPQ